MIANKITLKLITSEFLVWFAMEDLRIHNFFLDHHLFFLSVTGLGKLSVKKHFNWIRDESFIPSNLFSPRGQWHPTPVLLPGKPHGRAAVHGVTKSRTQLSDFTFTFHFLALEKEMATHSSVLAWRIPGTGEPGGLPSMGLHESDTTEAT